MSPAAKSKIKEKSSGREMKTPTRNSIASGNTTASAYNPVSGTFHMLDPVNGALGSPLHSGRFKNIDEVDDSSAQQATSTDCDSVSNNGSCSGESEDQKDKNGSGRPENPPGLFTVNDKRDKIRQKNEKKHQRQKEKRAQELRDRCTVYLMTRKLEALSQQLVGMGFTSERATMALINCEGRVEDAVNWLLEVGDAELKKDPKAAANYKINISEELARIAAMEIKYKCPRAEVERAVVSCEGDIDRAEEILRSRRQDVLQPPIEDKSKQSMVKSPKSIPPHSNGRQLPNQAVPIQKSSDSSQGKMRSIEPMAHAPKREEKDFNYTKAKAQTTTKLLQPEATTKSIQPSRKAPSKSEWQSVPSQSETKAVTSTSLLSTSTSPSISYSVSSNLQVGNPSGRTFHNESRQRAVGSDGKTVHLGGRDSTVVQQAQLGFTAQFPHVNSGVSSASDKLPSLGQTDNHVNSSGKSNLQYGSVTITTDHKGITVGKAVGASAMKDIADVQSYYKPFLPSPINSVPAGWGTAAQLGYAPETSLLASGFLGSINPSRPTNTSRGYYGGWDNGMPGSAADWSNRPMVNCDYNSIDWSLASPRSASLLGTFVDSTNEGRLPHLAGASTRDTDVSNGLQRDVDGSYGLWQGSDGNRVSNSGMQYPEIGSESENVSSVFHEWTNPFAGKDIFSLPRRTVPSPSL